MGHYLITGIRIFHHVKDFDVGYDLYKNGIGEVGEESEFFIGLDTISR